MRSALILCVVLSLGVMPGRARAGNDDGILLGNDAAMTGGAVVAIGQDGSALWYNPGGIGGVERDSVDVSASAFVVRSYRIEGFMSYTTGERSDGNVLEIVSVPSALTLVRRLGPRTRLALGAFVPQSFDLVVRSKLDVPDRVDASWVLTVAQKTAVYHAGGGLGVRLADGLWVGASVFGVYRSNFGFAQFWGGFREEGQTAAFFGATTVSSYQSLGLEAGAGLQWRPARLWQLGLSVRSPGLQILEASRTLSLRGASSVAEDGSPVDVFETAEDNGLRGHADIVSPLRARLGIAYGDRSGWIALEGDVQHGLDNRLVSRAPTWNARLGGRLQLSEHIAAGLGVFTDRAPEHPVRDFGASRVDLYGGTAGLEWSTARPMEQQLPTQPRSLVISTTIAVRYAFGFGKVGGLRFDPAAAGEAVATEVPIDAVVQEASVHIGSALSF